MKNIRLILLLPALLAACSHAPSAPDVAQSECLILESEMADAEAVRQAALEGQKNAWKALLPVAAAARYTSHASAVSAADRRLRELRVESVRRQCHEG